MTTDSPWAISSNPFAKYSDPTRPDNNRNIPLWQLVRASTAAPVFFPPEILNWDPNDPNKSFVFVDGGLTPYNNPAFLLFRMATQPAYRLKWKTGEQNLLLVSVGTGAAAGVTDAVERNIVGNMQNLPSELMYGIQVEQDINCRTLGRCVHGSEIDREMGNLVLPAETPDLGRFFRYVRYNADLSQKGLNDLGLDDIEAAAVQKWMLSDRSKICRASARPWGKRKSRSSTSGLLFDPAHLPLGPLLARLRTGTFRAFVRLDEL